ncbi:SCO family protein [Phaeovibrio sulfidiphilus]|uniref:SCO family protein n=1 Tax=Phaeovibrio sulfidiphilus TaxID=1220600 RepID=A0A8J6YQM2_9PROT|nr:SCO family protein [Phaeovibrio sulfidiphilus]MBE1237931.1 SCO family protein [Phaeovibrio sulfidiphilus]
MSCVPPPPETPDRPSADRTKRKGGSLTGRIVGTLVASALFLAILYGGEGFLPGLGGPGSGIGGPFQLSDASGEAYTDQSFPNRLLLIQFGKPAPMVDGHPETPGWLAPVGEALARLSAQERARVAAVFVGLDPDADSPDDVDAYARATSPDILGLTGTPDQIDSVLKEYRVEVRRDTNPDGSPAAITAFSANTYLLSPEGRYITWFPPGASPDDIVSVLRKVMGTERAQTP